MTRGAAFCLCRILCKISTLDIRHFFFRFLDVFVNMHNEIIKLPENIQELNNMTCYYEAEGLSATVGIFSSWGWIARESELPKKSHITQPPKPPKIVTVHTYPTPWQFFMISPPKIFLWKSLSYQNTCEDPAHNVVEAHGAAKSRCAMVWLLAGVPSILGIKCWSVWGGGALILHYNIRRVWIVPEYVPGPRTQCCCSARRCAALVCYGLVAGGCLIYFGDQMLERLGGGDASIIHYNTRRASIISYFSFFK